MNTICRWSGAFAAALGCSILAIPVAAQSPDTTAARAMSTTTLLRGGEMGELLSVYVPRAEAVIRRLLDGARDMESSAKSEIGEARRLAEEADGRARIMNEEIKTTKVRRDVAKKAKDQATSAELDAATKQQEREKEYLEKLRDALRADADRLEADQAAAAAGVKDLELELRVARMNAEMGVEPITAERAAEYRSLLREMGEAKKESAERWRDAADKRKEVAERRLKQLESLSKLTRS